MLCEAVCAVEGSTQERLASSVAESRYYGSRVKVEDLAFDNSPIMSIFLFCYLLPSRELLQLQQPQGGVLLHPAVPALHHVTLQQLPALLPGQVARPVARGLQGNLQTVEPPRQHLR